MSITPLDMQVVINKMPEVSKIQQARDHQVVVDHDHGVVQFGQEEALKQKQVQNTNKTEGQKIKREDKRQDERENSGDRKKRQAENDDDSEIVMAVDENRGRLIDLKC